MNDNKKTYYDILEVSRYATDEVINRAHKVLVKRYHPDVQKDSESRKKAAEEMVKVNEAYEVLSDKNKKAKYDKKLELEEQRKNMQNSSNGYSTYNTNIRSSKKNNSNINRNAGQNVNKSMVNIQNNQAEEEIERQRRLIEMQGDAIRENMRQQYYNQLRSMGYTIKEPFSWKKAKRIAILIIALIVINFLIFNIPFLANLMSDLEFSNPILAIFIRILRGIFLIRKV